MARFGVEKGRKTRRKEVKREGKKIKKKNTGKVIYNYFSIVYFFYSRILSGLQNTNDSTKRTVAAWITL